LSTVAKKQNENDELDDTSIKELTEVLKAKKKDLLEKRTKLSKIEFDFRFIRLCKPCEYSKLRNQLSRFELVHQQLLFQSRSLRLLLDCL
jgi:hypothetical protein